MICRQQKNSPCGDCFFVPCLTSVAVCLCTQKLALLHIFERAKPFIRVDLKIPCCYGWKSSFSNIMFIHQLIKSRPADVKFFCRLAYIALVAAEGLFNQGALQCVPRFFQPQSYVR